jgi:hypothetical protein
VGTNRIRHRGHISVKKNKSPFDEFQRAFLLNVPKFASSSSCVNGMMQSFILLSS